MAMSFTISRPSSAVFSHAIRPIASSKMMSAVSINNTICSGGTRRFCTDSKKKLLNEKILRALNSEIKSEEQLRTKHMTPPVPPPDFLFTIEDINSWDGNRITLKRDFNGEKIELLVTFCHDGYEYGEDDEEEGGQSTNGVSDEEKPLAERYAPSVEVEVKISKRSGRKIMLEVSAATDVGVGANYIWVAEESAADHRGRPYARKKNPSF